MRTVAWPWPGFSDELLAAMWPTTRLSFEPKIVYIAVYVARDSPVNPSGAVFRFERRCPKFVI